MFYLFAIILIILAFTVLALHIFFAQIEFLILSVAAWFCIPFAAFNKTSFVSTKGIGYVASVGLRVLALSLLAAVSTVALVMFEGAKIDGLSSAFGLIVLASSLLVSNVKAPATAAALINSGPVMDAAMAWHAMRAGASGGLRTLGSGSGSAKGGGGIVGGMARGVSSVASAAGGMASAGMKAVSTAWNTGSSSSGGTGSNQAGQSGQSGQSNSTSTQGQYRGGWSSGNRSAASPKPANPKNP
jgi:type IV secretory pathway TrbL component